MYKTDFGYLVVVLTLFLISSPDNSDESLHTNVSGSIVQSENACGHLCVCQWKASCHHQVSCVFVLFEGPSTAYMLTLNSVSLAQTGGRRVFPEKWPPESTATLTGRSPCRVIIFWCPAERHTRRHSPASPRTMRRSLPTASPSIFSVSGMALWIICLPEAAKFTLSLPCLRRTRCFSWWFWWELVPQ